MPVSRIAFCCVDTARRAQAVAFFTERACLIQSNPGNDKVRSVFAVWGHCRVEVVATRLGLAFICSRTPGNGCSTSGFRIEGDGRKRLGILDVGSGYDQRSVLARSWGVGLKGGVCLHMGERKKIPNLRPYTGGSAHLVGS